jgi:hypothetical protein
MPSFFSVEMGFHKFFPLRLAWNCYLPGEGRGGRRGRERKRGGKGSKPLS